MNLEDNKTLRLLIEAGAVGIITVVVGYVITWILSNFSIEAKNVNKTFLKKNLRQRKSFVADFATIYRQR